MSLKHCLVSEIFISERDTQMGFSLTSTETFYAFEEKGTKWLGQGLICTQNFFLWTLSACTPMCVVHISVQPGRSWAEEQKSSIISSFYFWDPCSSSLIRSVTVWTVQCPALSRSCCFRVPPFVNAHFPTAHPGLVFRKLKLSICEKKRPSSHPRLYTQI